MLTHTQTICYTPRGGLAVAGGPGAPQEERVAGSPAMGRGDRGGQG